MPTGIFWGMILSWVVCGTALWGVNAMGGSPKPARFALGKTIWIKTFKVNERGITLQITDSGSPLDGLTLTIPPGALHGEVTFSLGYNTGKLRDYSGQPSGVALVLSAETPIQFDEHITIAVPYPTKMKPLEIVGYEIDEQGQLNSIDTEMDRKNNLVSFYTFKPLMLTWIYILDQ